VRKEIDVFAGDMVSPKIATSVNMVVEKVKYIRKEKGEMADENPHVTCYWFNDGRTIQHNDFRGDELCAIGGNETILMFRE